MRSPFSANTDRDDVEDKDNDDNKDNKANTALSSIPTSSPYYKPRHDPNLEYPGLSNKPCPQYKRLKKSIAKYYLIPVEQLDQAVTTIELVMTCAAN
ncbi:uncharacterized protein TRUGW13939_09744 [Talaromyces rugulosus]|uniref:Uncharacterized protein n=1 Tax=Talaromyces rugulosus TaxID=121627 RepID=A0A7H8RDE9_TALRU|nr:uncharacterized protein TRUGW13939_09744 [Talaromyces rugulosus]QKX62583.1 hypothetical protein TRUGW13939_09744 [Talaromyces rugulosus]